MYVIGVLKKNGSFKGVKKNETGISQRQLRETLNNAADVLQYVVMSRFLGEQKVNSDRDNLRLSIGKMQDVNITHYFDEEKNQWRSFGFGPAARKELEHV